MPIKKRNFTEDFRAEAVRLALISDQPHHDTALNLCVARLMKDNGLQARQVPLQVHDR